MYLNNRSSPHWAFWYRFWDKFLSFWNCFLCFLRFWSFKLDSLNVRRHLSGVIRILSIYWSFRSHWFYSIKLLSHWSRCFWIWILFLWSILCVCYFRKTLYSIHLLLSCWVLTSIWVFICTCLSFLFRFNCKINIRCFIIFRTNKSQLY